MRFVPSIATGLSFVLLGGAIMAWWVSSVEYGTITDHLNGISPDGEARSYSRILHTRVQGHLQVLAVVLACLSVATFLLRDKLVLSFTGVGGAGHFREELRKLWKELTKRTSPAHKRIVFLLILIGTVLRGWMLFQPVTYDEAFTFTYYASRPLHIILADYSYPNNHILHTLLVKVSMGVFGVGKVSLRLPAFIAGVLVMPLFYVFVRRMFNRHIALMALAFVVSSARLIEYSALGRGYSITWLCLICALLLGRNFAKENGPFSAMLIGASCALGMWAVPTMIYGAAMVYLWLAAYLWSRYKESLQGRLVNWLWSLVVFVVLTGLLYAPVLVVSGLDGVLYHDMMPDRDLTSFSLRYGDDALELWAWFIDASHYWVGILGFAGLIFAAFISTKYRFLVAAMFCGAVPIVVFHLMVAPPYVWTYTLFIFHLSSAIALYYLLKLVHDKAMTSLTERRRTITTAILITVAFSWSAMEVLLQDPSRSTGAADTAEYLATNLAERDRVLVQYPWEAPVEFEAVARGVDRSVFHRPGPVNGRLYAVVGTAEDQTIQGVAAHNGIPASAIAPLVMVQNSEGLKIFAAPLGNVPPSEHAPLTTNPGP